MTDEGSSSRKGFVILAVLMVALIFSQLDRLALSALIENIKYDLSLSDRELGILQGGAFGLFYTIMGLPLGYLADRWSNRGTIILGYVVWSGATLLSGLAGSYPHLLAARLGVGAGEAALSPAGYSLIRQNFRPERISLAISVFQMGSVIGLSSAFAVIGGLQAVFMDDAVKGLLPTSLAHWQLTFLALGFLGFLFLPVLFLLKDRPGSPVAEAQNASAVLRAPLLPFLRAHMRTWLPLFLGMSGVIVLLYALMGWLPAIFAREFGWGPTRFGPIFGGIVFVTSATGILIGGGLTDLLNVRSNGRAHLILPLWVCAALLPLVALLAVLASPWPILAVAGLIVFLVFIPLSVAPTFVQLWAPPTLKGQVSAVYILFVNGISLSLAPIAIGFLSEAAQRDVYSLRFAITAVAGGMLILSLAMLLLLRRRGATSGLAADMGGPRKGA